MIGWLIFPVGLWTLKKREIQEDSGKNKDDFSHGCSFQTGVFILLLVCAALGCCSSLENILLGLYVSLVTLRLSLMLISHHGQRCQLVCKRQWYGHRTPLICNCIVILWQFQEQSLTKSSKLSLKKGPVMPVPYLNSPLYALSLTALWLASQCGGDTLVCDSNTRHSYENHSLWYLNFNSIMNPLNSSAFNILMQLFLKTLILHFIIFRVPPAPPPSSLHGKGMVVFLCNMLTLCGETWELSEIPYLWSSK